MMSIDKKADLQTLGDLKVLLKKLPRLDEELDSFAADLEEIRNDQPPVVMGDVWE